MGKDKQCAGLIGKRRGGATACRLGRTERGSTTGRKGHGDGEEVWWGKTEVPAEDKVQSSHGEIKGFVRRKGGSRRKWRHSGRTKCENCKSVVNDDEQFRTNRSGCLPAIIYLTTPILVTLCAWILHCWLGWQSTSSLSAEE